MLIQWTESLPVRDGISGTVEELVGGGGAFMPSTGGQGGQGRETDKTDLPWTLKLPERG